MSSCRTPRQADIINYFGGEIFCDSADRYIITDCATGNNFVLESNAQLKEVAAEYDKQTKFQGQRIFAEIEGRIAQWNDTLPVLRVERFIGFDHLMSCMLSYTVTGTYHVAAGDFTGVLTINSDYTYHCREANLAVSDIEEESSGVWHLTSALELILNESSPNIEKHSFEIVPPQFSVVSNDGGEPLVYTKI